MPRWPVSRWNFPPTVRVINDVMGNILKDLQYGFRMLLARPGFTAVAVLSLPLGIGLNTTIFSVVNASLLRPAPVESPGELVAVYSRNPEGMDYSTISYPDYRDFREQADAFSGILGYSLTMASLSQEGRSELIMGEVVTGNYFDVLGVGARLGRTFLPEESKTPGGHPVVVLQAAIRRRSRCPRRDDQAERAPIHGNRRFAAELHRRIPWLVRRDLGAHDDGRTDRIDGDDAKRDLGQIPFGHSSDGLELFGPRDHPYPLSQNVRECPISSVLGSC